ncbi:hypothetical protein ACFRQM_45935 [Streptomyces sp. NPDC056831]|uniref:hypothetical protein n=1 Tax=Streptomyces sp. NPDC056831 TaxID=3345954 RepID=UPI00367C421C
MRSTIRSARGQVEADLARWRREAEEGRPYAIGSQGKRLHRWNCQTLPTVEHSLELLEREIEAARRNGYAPDVLWQAPATAPHGGGTAQAPGPTAQLRHVRTRPALAGASVS